MDILLHNRAAWDKRVQDGDRWTRPVTSDVIDRARRGDFRLVLTPTKPVPTSWYPVLAGSRTLCLASGGGQQAPVLAACGAVVTVLDNSPRQLEQDRLVARRDGLALETVQGDMADLSAFADGTFALIFHPCSNSYTPDIRRVWRECSRVLRRGGILLAGFTNPIRHIFDEALMDAGKLEVQNVVPNSDLANAGRRELAVQEMRALEFAHTLVDQIGGQLDAGLILTGFFEDRYEEADKDPLSRYIDSFIATRAIKP